MLEKLKQNWQRFEQEFLDAQSSEKFVISAKLTPEYLIGENSGREFGRVAWSDIELVAINIEGDFQPFPYWYIGHSEQGVRLPNDAENMGDVLAALAQKLPGFISPTTRQNVETALQAAEGYYYIWQR